MSAEPGGKRKPRLPVAGGRPKRWYIDRPDGCGDFVILRILPGEMVLACRRPGSCKFTSAERIKLIDGARRMRLEVAERAAMSDAPHPWRRRMEQFPWKRWHFEPTPLGYMVFHRVGGTGGPTITQLVVCHLPRTHAFTSADRARLRAVAREVHMADAEREHGVGRA